MSLCNYFYVGVPSTYSSLYSFHWWTSTQLRLIQLLVVTFLPTIGCYLQLNECVDLGSICTFHSPLQALGSISLFFLICTPPPTCSLRLSSTHSSVSLAFLLFRSSSTIPPNMLNISIPSSLQPPYIEEASSFFVYFPTLCGVRGSPLLSSWYLFFHLCIYTS